MPVRMTKQLLSKFAPRKAATAATTMQLLSRRGMKHYAIKDQLYGLNDQSQSLRQAAFQLFQTELAPHAQEIDKTDHFPGMLNLWKKMGSLGFLGITAEPEYFGCGGSYLNHCIIMEEMSRAAGGIALSYAAHSNLCINQLTKHGTPEQKAKYIPKLCHGEHIGGLAVTEPEAGSDALAMQLRADRRGECYVLNGNKFWITNGSIADILIIFARTAAGGPDKNAITAFIVETGSDGFRVGKKLDKMGMRGSPTSELIFQNVKVPACNILGKENQGINLLTSGLNLERLIYAAGPVGLMQAAVDCSFEYAHQRKQKGKKIGEFQIMQAKMADMYTTLSACRSYLYNVARACDAGLANAKDCAGVILYCAERATKMGLDALQIFGGNGYISDNPAGRIVRDAKLYEIGAGTAEIRRWVIGRQINAEYKER